MLFGSKKQTCKLIVHRFWSLQQTSQYAKYQTYTNIQDVYCVAVLQCCSSKNGCMKVWNELYIYIYIDIELFFAYGKGFLRTATLQHCNKMLSFPDFSWQFLLPFLQWWKKIKKSCQKIREPQWQCCTFALERLNTHRLATDVRHLSSLRVLCTLLLGKWGRSILSRHSPSKSQSGWDSRRRKQRENETANDPPSFFDRLTYTKRELYLFSKEIRRIHADLW